VRPVRPARLMVEPEPAPLPTTLKPPSGSQQRTDLPPMSLPTTAVRPPNSSWWKRALQKIALSTTLGLSAGRTTVPARPVPEMLVKSSAPVRTEPIPAPLLPKSTPLTTVSTRELAPVTPTPRSIPESEARVTIWPALSAVTQNITPPPKAMPNPEEKKKKKPPFVLKLPQEKAPHLSEYRNWIGVLQSDPKYVRGNTNQLDIWHKTLRLGGGDPIPASVYERGHAMGLTGKSGERQIRVPNWTRARRPNRINMEVDHRVELQFTPRERRSMFDNIHNYELLDERSNVASRNRFRGNVKRERAIQLAADPSLTPDSVIRFDDVQLDDGGTGGERWILDEIRAGEQLDAYEKHSQR